jgi:hypothetical protein
MTVATHCARRRRIAMVKEECAARIHEFEMTIEDLEDRKQDVTQTETVMQRDEGAEILIKLEDHRPLPPDPRVTHWFEKEVYIDIRSPEEEFSFLITYFEDPEANATDVDSVTDMVQLHLNGVWQDWDDNEGYDPKKPLRFVRPTREKIEKGVPVTFTKNEEKELKQAVGGAPPFFHRRMPRAPLLYCLVVPCLSMVCSPQAPPLLHWDAGPRVYGLCHVPVLGRLHFVRH